MKPRVVKRIMRPVTEAALRKKESLEVPESIPPVVERGRFGAEVCRIRRPRAGEASRRELVCCRTPKNIREDMMNGKEEEDGFYTTGPLGDGSALWRESGIRTMNRRSQNPPSLTKLSRA